MTSFFLDLNVWLALSVEGHLHDAEARYWLNAVPRDGLLIFSRYTQIGLLRLLTNQAAMGDRILTLKQAWAVYDAWREDPRVEFYPEPSGVETAFRVATVPFDNKPASKSVGDCYLMAFALECRATLVTFDKALLNAARKSECPVIVPA